MTVEYRLDVYTAAGVLQAVLTGSASGGFRTLTYNKRVNEGGLLQFSLDGTDPMVALLEDKGIVEVWRRNLAESIAWYCDMIGLYRKQERFYSTGPEFVATCQHPLALLGWRTIGWLAGTADRSMFIADPAETVMKVMVDYNASANATVANGREREPNTLGITVQADGANGNVVDWYCAWDNLLESLRELAQVGGGDYDLVSTGAAAWEFRWYTGQLGTDRTASLIFSLEHGNMANPVYRLDRLREATAAIVCGDGVGAARNVTIRTGTDYAAGNDIEIVHANGMLTTVAGRETAGDRKLLERQAEPTFDFDVIQEGAKLYGRDYFLGDLVKARYDVVEETRKIVAISVNWQVDGKEVITVEAGQV